MKKNKIIEFLNDTANGNYSVEIANKMSGNVKRMPHNHINVLYMLRELMGDKCKNYLEIAVYYGASFILVMQNKYPCNFVGIDFFDKVRYGENRKLVFGFDGDRVKFHENIEEGSPKIIQAEEDEEIADMLKRVKQIDFLGKQK